MQTFVSDGVTLAYRDIPPEGVDLGEPILLIHGFASTHRINWVDPRWAATLTKAGRRVILFDNRGHGESEKLYDPEAYATPNMARDASNLLDPSRRPPRRRDGLFDGRAHRRVSRPRRSRCGCAR